MSDKKSTQGADSSPPSGASKVTPVSAQTEATVGKNAEGSAPAAIGLPDLEAHAEAPGWLSGSDDHDSHLWDGAFQTEAGAAAAQEKPAAPDKAAAQEKVVASDTVGAPEDGAPSDAVPAAEPTVVKPEDVTLETPTLANPDISAEAADAASLDDATAEVKAVEAEAADAAVMTDPAANHPAAANHTEGIAAAAPMTENIPGGGEGNDADDTTDAADAKDDAGSGTAAGAAASTAATGEDAPSAPETAAGAEPADSRRSRRSAAPPAPEGAQNKGGNKRILLIVGALAVVAVLVVLLFTVLGNSEKEPGVLEEDVAPIELDSGACLKDFSGINDPTTVVTCETPHNAQLVATATYPDSDEFPGADALSARATEICSDVRYSETLSERGDLDLQENKVIPTPESWNDGDRRIDCFVVAGGDQELTETLLVE